MSDYSAEWFEFLKEEYSQPYMKSISDFIKERRKTTIVYPENNKIFRCFTECPLKDIKLVIIGQDPYHDGSATGLAFSNSTNTFKASKSLQVILNAIEESIYNGLQLNQDPDLTRWANQGILLLNSILTVENGKPLSHGDIGWEKFTKFVVTKLSSQTTIPYLIMGNKQATEYSNCISKGKIFKTEHPAASLYQGRKWNYNNVFNEINNYLVNDLKKSKIIW